VADRTVHRRPLFSREGMPSWIPGLVVAIFGIVVGLFAAFNVLQRLRGLLILLLISLFLSIALEPGVNYLHRRGWRRGLATWALFLVVLVAGGVFIGLMVPLIVDQTLLLVDRIPSYIDQAAEYAARFGVDFSSERVADAVTNLDSSLQTVAADVAGSVFGVGTALLSTVLQLLTIGLFTFYMTAEGPRLRRAVCSLLPPERQREVLRVLDIAIDKTGGYFYSRALLAGVAATVGWATFRIIGVPFALALALWLGILSQFVPVVGTYIGGVLPLVIALLESPAKAIAVLVFIVVYQQVENYLPAVSFGSAIAGGTLLGIPGALMALPIAATVQAFVSTYLRRHEVVDDPLTDEGDENEEAPADARP
jgi:predicted PurR-regulated permease PerM